MRAGELRHRISVQRPITSRNEIGEEVVAWETAAVVWAALVPISGRELLQSNQPLGEITTRVRVRWENAIADINPKWRLLHGPTIYNVKSAFPKEMRRREIEIMCGSGMKDE